jgi:mannose-1-phosphate guanylyltransferase/mannose-6-phosphate isomerase
MKIIILAGGTGTRLWPLSQENHPKQFVKFQQQENSLFQETILRSLLLVSMEDIFIVSNMQYSGFILKDLKEINQTLPLENIILEPEAKGTLPAIYAGVHTCASKQEETVLILSSDHLIKNNATFVQLIRQSEKLAQNHLVTFGIQPDHPHTGYGYIAPGRSIKNGFKVNSFHEKPNAKKALAYIENGYYWNAGIFLLNSTLFKEEVRTLAPNVYQAFATSHNLDEIYAKIHKKSSVDVGILEKSQCVAVVPAAIQWTDLGSFDALYEQRQKDACNNVTEKRHIHLSSTDNLILAESNKTIATIGVDNLLIVDHGEYLLVCKKNHSQRVKEVAEIIRKDKS